MNDPDDKTLLEFVARFAGCKETERYGVLVVGIQAHGPWGTQPLPNYLNSVDAWLRDVWPKMPEDESLYNKWILELQFAYGHTNLIVKLINADARSRCLALWRALEGKLP